jgi:transposase
LFRVGRERSGVKLWQTSSQILITTATEEKNEERRFGAATSNRISVYPEQRPLFLQLYTKEKEMARRYVGIDLAKRTMEVCIVEGKQIERHGLTTDEKGRKILALLLRKTDVVGYEVCSYGNRLARTLQNEVGCQVTPLNAGELRIIWKSRKKTDKEDSLKLAKYLRDTPEEEQCTVPLPKEEEEAFRSDISMKEFLKKERNAAINRLHALYGQMGIITVTKKDLKDSKGREARHGELPEMLQGYARILQEQLELFEKQLKEMEEKVADTARDHELAPYIMSIPGIGIGIAAVILAYLGDGSRFSKPGQVANYAGLAPRVDCSGETEHYGTIAKYQFCHPIRGIVLEGVWAMIRNGKGPLFTKYTSLAERMSKRKSAVAVARKMVILAWLLMKRREYYSGVNNAALEKKLHHYKVKKLAELAVSA